MVWKIRSCYIKMCFFEFIIFKNKSFGKKVIFNYRINKKWYDYSKIYI